MGCDCECHGPPESKPAGMRLREPHSFVRDEFAALRTTASEVLRERDATIARLTAALRKLATVGEDGHGFETAAGVVRYVRDVAREALRAGERGER